MCISNVLNVPSFNTAISYAPNIITSLFYSLNFKSNLQAKGPFFLLNPASTTEILDWISRVNITPSNPNRWNNAKFSVLFELPKSVVGMVVLGISWPRLVHNLFYSIAHININQSINLALQHSFSLTKQYEIFTISQMRITCPPTIKFRNPWRVSLVRYSLYMWNRIADKQQQYLLLFHSIQLLSPLVSVIF